VPPPVPEYPIIARKPPAPPSPPEEPPAAAPRGAVGPRRRAPARAGTAAKPPAPPGTPRKKAAVAGPARGRAPAKRERAESDRLDQLQAVIVASLEDDKAEEVVTLDLAGRASFADRMVIATGIADRQIAAMATHLEEKLRAAGLRRIQIEGATGTDWVLIDAGDIVIHLFKPDARALYGLERMWGAELDEEPATAV
jgi:ribosome silencing factor RsfS/YbeB/iojap